MAEQKYQHNSCTRREFVIASGVVIAGGLVSCGKQISAPEAITRTVPSTIRVRIGKNVEQVTIGNNTFKAKALGNAIKTIAIKPKTQVTISGKTKTITGTIVLQPKEREPDRAFDVVACVPIEQYVPGVIAGELFAHWHFDTFAAQAVAARSYATTQHNARATSSHYDVTDGPSSQMFLGDVTLDVAHRAVEETSGVVLIWNNEVVPAYYSSCCGGLAATASDAISGAAQHAIPPLLGHDGKDFCTTLDVHSWTAHRPARSLRKRLNASAKSLRLPKLSDVRTIKSIEPISTNKHGRPKELVIQGRRNESCVLRARDFVRAANMQVPSLPPITNLAWSSYLAGHKVGATLQLKGLGMGHGVGLCQYGAQVLAGRDESWQNILSWYYPQATLAS
ncbi:MAG: SpoIID/LytB domain-containing protein [Planctomycetes bacterium]|nr:SpoIID/LytB domain-containing protein [Planctomycetota bacterium]